MAQSVVVKKEEKVNKIFTVLGKDCTVEEFSRKFKEDYPDDWERINNILIKFKSGIEMLISENRI